jgi:hypothetical protein
MLRPRMKIGTMAVFIQKYNTVSGIDSVCSIATRKTERLRCTGRCRPADCQLQKRIKGNKKKVSKNDDLANMRVFPTYDYRVVLFGAELFILNIKLFQ